MISFQTIKFLRSPEKDAVLHLVGAAFSRDHLISRLEAAATVHLTTRAFRTIDLLI